MLPVVRDFTSMSSFFSYIGNLFFAVPQRKCLEIGLYGSGKTTILNQIMGREVFETIPTSGFVVENVQRPGCNMEIWDVGSSESLKPLWKHYFQGTHAVIFVLDTNDDENFGKNKF